MFLASFQFCSSPVSVKLARGGLCLPRQWVCRAVFTGCTEICAAIFCLQLLHRERASFSHSFLSQISLLVKTPKIRVCYWDVVNTMSWIPSCGFCLYQYIWLVTNAPKLWLQFIWAGSPIRAQRIPGVIMTSLCTPGENKNLIVTLLL